RRLETEKDLQRRVLTQSGVSETVWRRCPLTTARTAGARRNTRASLVCFNNGSKVGRASSGKWRLRVRMVGVSRKNYDRNSLWHMAPLIKTKSFRLKFPWSCLYSNFLNIKIGIVAYW